MPIYEYRCNDCGEVFDKMVRFSEVERSPVCPTCESSHTQKKLSTISSFGSSSTSSTASSGSSCSPRGGFS